MLVEQAITVVTAGIVAGRTGFHQHLAREVAPGEIGRNAAPDHDVGGAAVELRGHRLDDGHREPDRIEVRQCIVDLGKRCPEAGGEPDLCAGPITLRHSNLQWVCGTARRSLQRNEPPVPCALA